MPRRLFITVLALFGVIRPCLVASCLLASGGLAAARAAEPEQGPRISLIRDAEIERLLRAFLTPLYRVAGLDASQLNIQIVRDSAINAFVTSGNRMYIHTGLLQQAGSALEVIGVLAHETAHVKHGDPVKLPDRMREAMLTGIASMLIGVTAGAVSRQADAGLAAALGGQSMALRQFLSFTRAQESGADQGALQMLDRLGWSARGMLDLFARMKDQELLAVGRQDPYLQSHPLTRDRVQFVEQHVARSPHSDKPLPAEFETGFAMVKAKLDGFLDAPVIVFRKYPDRDQSNPARYARAIALYRSGRSAEAIETLNALIRALPGSPWLHELKGQVLFESGRIAEALPAYREAARLAPEQPLIRVGLARAMVESSDPALARAAIGELQRALDRDRQDPDTWRLLSRAWGRVGEIGQANLALAEEAMIREDIPMARRFAREAEKQLPPGPARLRAQDIANAVRKENRPR
jgi:predicted Zn-dependent protease